MKTVIVSFVLIASFITVSCVKKEFDSPPEKIIPEGMILTIQDLRDMYSNSRISIQEDYSVFAVVTADEKSGNLYKNIFIEDATNGIVVRTLYSGGLLQGDSVRVALKGTVLSSFNGMLQLDSVDVDRNMIKQANKVNFEPALTDIQTINAGNFQGRLIKLENVEFKGIELGKTYADGINQSTENRTLVDCNGNEVLVRTSGYADFANEVIAEGHGTFIGVVSQWNSDMQLYIRDLSDITFDADRCTAGGTEICPEVGSINQGFDGASDNTDFFEKCWFNIAESGSRLWRGRASGGNHIQATAFQSGEKNVSWIIAPPVSANGNNTLTFKTQTSFYTHDPVTVWVSTDFNGVATNIANWVKLNPTLAGSSSSWVNSGTINLTAALPAGYTGKFFVGFKYDGDGDAGKTTSFRIDDIVID